MSIKAFWFLTVFVFLQASCAFFYRNPSTISFAIIATFFVLAFEYLSLAYLVSDSEKRKKLQAADDGLVSIIRNSFGCFIISCIIFYVIARISVSAFSARMAVEIDLINRSWDGASSISSQGLIFLLIATTPIVLHYVLSLYSLRHIFGQARDLRAAKDRYDSLNASESGLTEEEIHQVIAQGSHLAQFEAQRMVEMRRASRRRKEENI